MNAPEIRAASLPSMGGIASAQALAKFYAMLASGGTWNGRAFFNKETMAWMSTRLTQGFDPVLQRELSLSAGFMMDPIDGDGKKICSLLGPSPSAFGHAGAGGGKQADAFVIELHAVRMPDIITQPAEVLGILRRRAVELLAAVGDVVVVLGQMGVQAHTVAARQQG